MLAGFTNAPWLPVVSSCPLTLIKGYTIAGGGITHWHPVKKAEAWQL